MAKRYRSGALAAVHETALGLADAGVMPKRTMKAFDEMCLTPVEPLTPAQIRRIRLKEKASQACSRGTSMSQPAWSASGNEAKNTRVAPRSSC